MHTAASLLSERFKLPISAEEVAAFRVYTCTHTYDAFNFITDRVVARDVFFSGLESEVFMRSGKEKVLMALRCVCAQWHSSAEIG